MKGIDIFCASQTSTAICMNMDPGTSSTVQLGGKAIDRHNPIIRDERRIGRGVPTPPCSTHQSPINPKPYRKVQKCGKSSPKSKGNGKRSSSNQNKNSNSNTTTDIVQKHVLKPTEISSNCIEPSGLVTPPESSRYLLSEAACFDGLTDYDPGSASARVESKRALAVVPDEVPIETMKTLDVSMEQVLAEKKNIKAVELNKSNAKNPVSASLSGSSSNQVVVLRVSLHCKGCARKVSKYLSKMQGVTSFNIDFAAKKVTVVGDVTPLSVLASISKVKNAQFWMPGSAGNNEIKK